MTIKAINVRNQFKGTVKEIIEGPVLSEIDVQTAAGIVTSVITTRSVKELELAIGSEAVSYTHLDVYKRQEPSFQALRAIPSLAWVPLLLLWFGIDETPKIVLIALGAFFPVYLALVAGVRCV